MIVVYIFFMWFPVSLPSLLKKAPDRRPESPPTVPMVSWPHVPFFACFFVLFVLTEAPPSGKAAVNVKAMPPIPPVSRWIHCRLFFCQLHKRMFCLIFSSRMWQPCIRRSLCWKLFLDLCIDIFQCPLHVLLFFYSGQREKESCLEWSQQGTLFCMYCMCCMFFWCFLFYSRKWKSWAKKSTSWRRFLFFWMSVIKKQKVDIGNCVLPGEAKSFDIESRLCQGVLLDILFVSKKKIYFHLLQFKELEGIYKLKAVSCLKELNFIFHLHLHFFCISKEKESLEAQLQNLGKDRMFACIFFLSK